MRTPGKKIGTVVGNDRKGRPICVGHTVLYGRQRYLVDGYGHLSNRTGGKKMCASIPAKLWKKEDCTIEYDPAKILTTEDKKAEILALYEKERQANPQLVFEEPAEEPADPAENYQLNLENLAKTIEAAKQIQLALQELQRTTDVQLATLQAIIEKV